MANPQNTGSFDFWITDRTTFVTLPPKASETGTFDRWLTDRLAFASYVEAAGAADLSISATDAISVNESVTPLILSFATASDAVGASESVLAQLLVSVQASDSVTVNESVTIVTGALILVVGDSSTVSDSANASVVTPGTGSVRVVIRRIYVSYLRQSTATTIKIGPFLDSSDGITPETTLTLSQADIRLSKDGAAFAQKNDAAAATHDENGWYAVALNIVDTGTAGRLQIAVNESGALPVWHEFAVISQSAYDEWMLGQDEIEFTYVLTSSQTGLPITSATIRFATDSPGLNTVWNGTTDTLGVARNACQEKPRLAAGQYFVFRSHPQFTFADPDVETVS